MRYSYIKLCMFLVLAWSCTNFAKNVGDVILELISAINRQKFITPSQEPRSEIYDFIVVGAGSAGSVIANRLSEVPHWNVLLIETGEEAGIYSQVPPLLAPILQLTDYNWKYFMEYDPGFARGMNKGILPWPRGKGVGGSSIINYMIYTRGHPRDFDRWAGQGNPGWSYAEVLPYFLKSERSSVAKGDPTFHNYDGYLSVEDVYQSELVKAFVRGGKELGYREVDYTGPDQIGFSTIQATTINGRRHSVAKAFLDPFRHRKNLQVVTSAHVTNLLINPLTKQTYGVEYVRNKRGHAVYASKEVILSAGAFNSPQILMLSGIGPKNHLDKLKIPVLRNLPVGRNLQDHVTYVGLTFLINESLSYTPAGVLNIKTIKNWFTNGKGPYTSLGGVEGLAYVRTNVSRDAFDFPDMELIFVGGALHSDYGIVNYKAMNIRDDVYKKVWKPVENIPSWTIFPMLLHPKSVGRMELRSRNPFDHPLFYGNYFSDPAGRDIDTMVASIRFIARLSRTEEFQRFGTRIHATPIPGCQRHRYDSDAYWRCALRTLSITLHHQVGTCKMGAQHDPTAVVDNELRVHGVGNLRVADTSVIPFALTAHTNAPSIMIGEKVSDMIKAAWGEWFT